MACACSGFILGKVAAVAIQPCNAAITLTVAPGDLAVQVLFRSDRDGPVRQVA